VSPRSAAASAWHLARQTALEWWRDDAPRLGAALAYYTVFSIAPVLVISVALAGFFFGEEAARGHVVDQLRGLMGADGASVVQSAIERASLRGGAGLGATALSVLTLLLGASGAFGQLQYALNRIWNVEGKTGGGVLRAARERFLSFSMVLLIGFLLLVSLVVSALLAMLDEFVSGRMEWLQPMLALVNLVVSLGVVTVLFAMMFKTLPDADVRWSDVWIGATVTALLFVVGKAAIGLYLGNSSVASVYGAAGSLVVVLLWVYYSAQILFLGAEFTQVFARWQRGGGKLPSPPKG